MGDARYLTIENEETGLAFRELKILPRLKRI